MAKSKRGISPSPRLASLATPLPQEERGNKIRVARIGAAHGVRGEVKLWSFTQDPMAVAGYGALETEDGTRRFAIESLRAGKDFLVARLAGIESRAAAQQLTNTELFVPRERLPPIEDDDTFYVSDLVGCAAVTADGNPLGTVNAVHNFGAGDIIEIAPADGSAPVMLSFTESNVPEVNLDAKRIVVAVPEEIEAREPNSAHSRASGNPER